MPYIVIVCIDTTVFGIAVPFNASELSILQQILQTGDKMWGLRYGKVMDFIFTPERATDENAEISTFGVFELGNCSDIDSYTSRSRYVSILHCPRQSSLPSVVLAFTGHICLLLYP